MTYLCVNFLEFLVVLVHLKVQFSCRNGNHSGSYESWCNKLCLRANIDWS